MPIFLKRAYDESSSEDGYRVLVDRLWPRGVSKDEAQLDEWLKEIAPSDALRKSYHSGELGWGEFRRRYLSELKDHRAALRPLAERTDHGPVTLVFSARDRERNNAVVLRQYLKMLSSG